LASIGESGCDIATLDDYLDDVIVMRPKPHGCALVELVKDRPGHIPFHDPLFVLICTLESKSIARIQ